MGNPSEFCHLEKYANEELSLVQWLTERRDNCLRLAENKARGKLDRAGWLQDAYYFDKALEEITR